MSNRRFLCADLKSGPKNFFIGFPTWGISFLPDIMPINRPILWLWIDRFTCPIWLGEAPLFGYAGNRQGNRVAEYGPKNYYLAAHQPGKDNHNFLAPCRHFPHPCTALTPMGVIRVFVSLPPPSANKAITCALMATWYAYQLGPTESTTLVTMQVRYKWTFDALHNVCFYVTWIESWAFSSWKRGNIKGSWHIS